MTIEVHLYPDDSVAVTRNGAPYNKWGEKRTDNGILVMIEEPEDDPGVPEIPEG